jgi:hypothetical protein
MTGDRPQKDGPMFDDRAERAELMAKWKLKGDSAELVSLYSLNSGMSGCASLKHGAQPRPRKQLFWDAQGRCISHGPDYDLVEVKEDRPVWFGNVYTTLDHIKKHNTFAEALKWSLDPDDDLIGPNLVCRFVVYESGRHEVIPRDVTEWPVKDKEPEPAPEPPLDELKARIEKAFGNKMIEFGGTPPCTIGCEPVAQEPEPPSREALQKVLANVRCIRIESPFGCPPFKVTYLKVDDQPPV